MRSLAIPVRASTFYQEIASFLPSQLFKAFIKSDPDLTGEIAPSWAKAENRNYWQLSALLRLGGERRGYRGNTTDDECTPVHHSMT